MPLFNNFFFSNVFNIFGPFALKLLRVNMQS